MPRTLAKIKRKGEARLARINTQLNPAVMNAKSKSRRAKSRTRAKSRSRNLPKIGRANINANYTNPVNLMEVSGIVYQLTNRFTGRKNWYSKNLIDKLIGRKLTNYQILMFDPKTPMFRNPMTRNPVFARNLRRVAAQVKN
jgi:hypothetical protein